MDEKDIRNAAMPDEALPDATSRKKRIAIALISLAVVAVLAVTAALLVREYVITTYVVDGDSMLPTLNGGVSGDTSDGDTLILNKVKDPERGDIIVFYYDWGDTSSFSPHHLVKRVIALPGDRVEIKDGELYLNGVLRNESYIKEAMRSWLDQNGGIHSSLSLTVPDGCVFAMGDNRNNSTDSRVIGCVPMDKIVGVCFLILSENGKLRTP